ncbi:MAG: DUF1512 domain-containing protein [Thaumarchaeota archaeon]|nr:DUF1512 domain-containing protein [Nitrososphaerota archaeon]MCL5317701.1 DUF1512 domain-containing protein [Nitrososphaerota archaeon]
MFIIPLFSLPGDGSLDNPIMYIIFYAPILLFFFYGQRIQSWMMLSEVSRSLNRLKNMKEKTRKETLEYIKNVLKPEGDPTERIDQFLEYFTIMPVETDPTGIMGKIEHIMVTRDERVREEVRAIGPKADPVQISTAENLLEITTTLNLIYKIVRHFYLMGKRTSSIYVLAQLQMLMPLILQEAEALNSAVDAFKQQQPIGDGIGAMVAAKFMLNTEKKTIARDTVYSQTDYNGRTLYLVKAEGPGGNVGQPGVALERLVNDLGVKANTIIMIDAALKLEGEKTGEIAEGIGAAIGGIGVDRFQIEEVATKNKIPLYAVVIKQSIIEAISVMRKEIAETTDRVIKRIDRIIEEKTKKGDTVIIVGVGNTFGVGQ